MNNGISWALGIFGCVLLVLLALSVARARKSGQMDASFLYFASLVLLTNASAVASQFSGGRLDYQTAAGQSIVTMPGVAAVVATLVVPGMLLVSFAYFVTQALRGPIIINPAAICYLLVLVTAGMGSLSSERLFMEGSKFALLGAAMATVLAPRNSRALNGAAHALALLVALSAILALVDPMSAADVCGDRKCGLLGNLYNGTYFNFNGFGMLMAAAAPVLYFGMARFGLLFASAAAFFAFASGSRTSQIAVLCVFALLLLSEYHTRGARRPPVVVPVSASALATSLMVALPLIGLSGDAFTGRAELWREALQRSEKSPLVGLGPDSWGSLQQIGVITRAAAYATHNQFVETVYVAGIFGLVAMISAGAFMLRANRKDLGRLAILLFPILLMGATERPWSLGPPDWLSWSLLLMVCTGVQGVGPKESMSSLPLRPTAYPDPRTPKKSAYPARPAWTAADRR